MKLKFELSLAVSNNNKLRPIYMWPSTLQIGKIYEYLKALSELPILMVQKQKLKTILVPPHTIMLIIFLSFEG